MASEWPVPTDHIRILRNSNLRFDCVRHCLLRQGRVLAASKVRAARVCSAARLAIVVRGHAFVWSHCVAQGVVLLFTALCRRLFVWIQYIRFCVGVVRVARIARAARRRRSAAYVAIQPASFLRFACSLIGLQLPLLYVDMFEVFFLYSIFLADGHCGKRRRSACCAARANWCVCSLCPVFIFPLSFRFCILSFVCCARFSLFNFVSDYMSGRL